MKVIELFAGAGGLALGLEQAGFEGVCFIEIDQAACATLRLNRPEWNVIEGDIYDISFKEYRGKVDLVSGGAPCQAFSYAGKGLGFGDTRGTLFHEFARCVEEVNPKMFLFENVRGLLSHDSGRTFNTIKNRFQELGYTIQKKVLNACYYGVGQKRERIFMVGTRDDLLENIHFVYPEPDKEWTTLRQALEGVPKSEGETYSERKRKVMELVPPGGCWVDLPDDVARDYMKKSYFLGGGRRGMARRISWDEPCLTLTTSPSQKQTERCHPEETRPFTVREYARIQSFPDDWEFSGTVSSKYRQIGNAVPVELARRVGVQLMKALNGEIREMKWDIDFIKEEDFEKHVAKTIQQYGENLKPFDLQKFNKNIVDPVKMTFDKYIYNKSWEEIISSEIFRQRDKSQNNTIGYFHQGLFNYIKGCRTPKNGEEGGWDVIVEMPNGYQVDDRNMVSKIYVEMKNKHNTMNSAAAGKTFIKMQSQLLNDDDCVCFLVEVIAKRHQNIIWSPRVDGQNVSHRKIRRVSIDEFYSIVTGDKNGFYKICIRLPETIEKVLKDSETVKTPDDTVIGELRSLVDNRKYETDDLAMMMAMYMLGFGTYSGFKDN